ncbi:Transcriptional coactivator HFI1/ADA1 [Erysiphe neolycopersici]|uniref:Transcriptional coactivator HFI1/ADA1 n=1 Tax=Erysiphe neolycopersici TaxID=212602 RepID=A0A420HMQ5_9PEZI|nr:Transcriptional coactivator HFI1/ADA1 [Erysiphe neolycopersici]
MPDIDPAALNRNTISSSSHQSQKLSSAPPAQNASRLTKPNVGPPPPRINLEPLYMALKVAIGENWPIYKDALVKFLMGNLNQAEFSAQIDHFIVTPTREKEHLHNKLVSAIYGNTTRELPDHNVATWVSANDKPFIGSSKPSSGDAAEQRLKVEVMQLPRKNRRKLKQLVRNEVEPQEVFSNIFGESRRPKPVPKLIEPISASVGGGFQMTNLDVEIRKKYVQPLASESGEFPDTSIIESRMLPICYETGIVSGHASDAPHFMSVATETFIKEVLSLIFTKTQSNGPGTSGTAGTGGGANWIQTYKYRCQLVKEEESSLRGETLRDKSGLLPIEARSAIERGPLGMADVRMALELGDCGLGQMPIVLQQIMLSYREGEVDLWDDFSWPKGHVHIVEKNIQNNTNDIEMRDVTTCAYEANPDSWGWEGCEPEHTAKLDDLLDSCLAV